MGGLGNWMILSPIGLAAGLMAIAVPWVIHWISRSQGRRVLIGSIQLVRQARRKLVHELRLTQWLLLAIRTLMLVVAALILGRLAAPGQEQIAGDAAYVTPRWLASAKAGDLEGLDRFGEVRVLAPGFPAVAEFTSEGAAAERDAWPLLAERLSIATHTGEVHVFSLDSQAEWGDWAPGLPTPVTWHGIEPATQTALNLALEVLVIDEAGGSARGTAATQALEAIRNHRLPGLNWHRLDSSRTSNAGDYDAVIRAAAGPPDLLISPGEHRLIDLNDEAWAQQWSSAEFPQLLLDALLNEEQTRQAWEGVPVIIAAAAASTNVIAHREHLPRRSLQPGLAIVLMLLWGIERWLAERSGRERV